MRDDGVLYICNLIDTAANGEMPNEVLEKVNKFWFENRYIGFSRQYAANGVNQRVDRLVRIEQDQSIQIGQYAVLGNGEQFRITLVSHGQDIDPRTKLTNNNYYRTPQIVGLKYTELTLTRLENYYDVNNGGGSV